MMACLFLHFLFTNVLIFKYNLYLCHQFGEKSGRMKALAIISR